MLTYAQTHEHKELKLSCRLLAVADLPRFVSVPPIFFFLLSCYWSTPGSAQILRSFSQSLSWRAQAQLLVGNKWSSIRHVPHANGIWKCCHVSVLRKVLLLLAADCGLVAETFFQVKCELCATCVRPQMEAHLFLLVGASGQLRNICLLIMLRNWCFCVSGSWSENEFF